MPRFPTVNKVKIAVAVVIAIIIVVIASQAVVTVQAGYRGVVLHLGAVQDRVLGEGLHFITPFAEQVVQMEVTYTEIPELILQRHQRIYRKFGQQ